MIEATFDRINKDTLDKEEARAADPWIIQSIRSVRSFMRRTYKTLDSGTYVPSTERDRALNRERQGEREARPNWHELMRALVDTQRARQVEVDGRTLWVAAERLSEFAHALERVDEEWAKAAPERFVV